NSNDDPGAPPPGGTLSLRWYPHGFIEKLVVPSASITPASDANSRHASDRYGRIASAPGTSSCTSQSINAGNILCASLCGKGFDPKPVWDASSPPARPRLGSGPNFRSLLEHLDGRQCIRVGDDIDHGWSAGAHGLAKCVAQIIRVGDPRAGAVHRPREHRVV